MGLNIYLRHYDNFEEFTKSKGIYYERYNCLGDKYDDIGDVESKTHERHRKEYFGSINVLNNEFLKFRQTDNGNFIKKKSKRHPENGLFEIGYFRSDYAGSGINDILGKYSIPNLHGIFNNKKDRCEFIPDWNRSLNNVRTSIIKLKNTINNATKEEASKDELKFHLGSLGIVEETIQWVLSRKDNKDYTLEWSG